MKKMALMAVSLMVCLYLAGCGSPDRNRQGREQLTADTGGRYGTGSRHGAGK